MSFGTRGKTVHIVWGHLSLGVYQAGVAPGTIVCDGYCEVLVIHRAQLELFETTQELLEQVQVSKAQRCDTICVSPPCSRIVFTTWMMRRWPRIIRGRLCGRYGLKRFVVHISSCAIAKEI